MLKTMLNFWDTIFIGAVLLALALVYWKTGEIYYSIMFIGGVVHYIMNHPEHWPKDRGLKL